MEGEGKCTCMNKCFKWQFYSSRRTPVQNYFSVNIFYFNNIQVIYML